MKNSFRRLVTFAKKLWPQRTPTIYRILFRHSDFRQLPEEHQLFFIRLAHVADDLRQSFISVSPQNEVRIRVPVMSASLQFTNCSSASGSSTAFYMKAGT